MNRFRKTLSYITIMVAIFVTVLSITNVVSGEVIRSLNLAVMSLIAILLTELVGLLPSTQLEPSISTLLEPESNLEELRQLILTSRRIKAWGTTFSTHIPMLQGGLRKAVVNLGLEIRFLLIKPHSCAVEMAELRDRNSNGRLNETLVRNLDILASIANGSANGKLEYKVLNYLGPYTMYIFDDHLPTGQIRLHLSNFHGQEVFDRPTIKITRKYDEIWFNYFVEQFERLWQEAELHSLIRDGRNTDDATRPFLTNGTT